MREKIYELLLPYQNLERQQKSLMYFQSFKGGYGEGDQFIGVPVPAQRKVAKQLEKEYSLVQLSDAIASPYHEVRLTSLFILILKFDKAISPNEQETYIDFYLKHTQHVNNWDLVDSSAYKLLGEHLLDKSDRSIIYRLSTSKNMWEQRISIVATYAFIKNNHYKDTLLLAEKFLSHPHDLMHKATGWMLREVAKRDPQLIIIFLKKHYNDIPRTMLRYTIEKFPEIERKNILLGKF